MASDSLLPKALAPISVPARTQEESHGADSNSILDRDKASGYNLIWELGDPSDSVERTLPTLRDRSGERLYFATGLLGNTVLPFLRLYTNTLLPNSLTKCKVAQIWPCN